MTITNIKSRCVEDGDCLIWQDRTNERGHPKYLQTSARRVVWNATHEQQLKPQELVTVTCGNPRCLQHLAKTNKSEAAKRGNASQAVKLKRGASIAKVKRETDGKITMDIARQIRASDKSGLEWADELDVSPSLISLVRRNKAWKEYGNNPFQGLLR